MRVEILKSIRQNNGQTYNGSTIVNYDSRGIPD